MSFLDLTIYAAMSCVILSGCAASSVPTMGTIHRNDPRLDELLSPGARIEVLAEGFDWSEGPLWVADGGYLLFSDIPKNTIYRWHETDGISVFMRPAGFAGDEPPGRELGTNGLLLDPQGRLVVCDHGNRQMARIDSVRFTRTVLADRYQGKRLNSPNDAVYRSNGDLYFTDPPYGLNGLDASPAKELPFNGVYRLSTDGALDLLLSDITFPNGIAFSPDEKTLYVAVSDRKRPVWMVYDVGASGGLSNGRVFFDATAWVEAGKKGLPDGLAVDRSGNIWATGPGGVHVFTPQGEHLGVIDTGQATANCAFGDDGATLYMTADGYLCRIRTRTLGLGF